MLLAAQPSGGVASQPAWMDRPYMLTGMLMSFCNGDDVPGPVPHYDTKEGRTKFCEGYISAVADSFNGFEAKGGFRFCLNQILPVINIRASMQVLTKEYKIQKHNSAVTTISHSLMDISPCADESRSALVSQINMSTLHTLCDKREEPESGFCGYYFVGAGDSFYKYRTEYSKAESCYSEYSPTHDELDGTLVCFMTYSDIGIAKGKGDDGAISGVRSCLEATIPCP